GTAFTSARCGAGLACGDCAGDRLCAEGCALSNRCSLTRRGASAVSAGLGACPGSAGSVAVVSSQPAAPLSTVALLPTVAPLSPAKLSRAKLSCARLSSWALLSREPPGATACCSTTGGAGSAA